MCIAKKFRWMDGLEKAAKLMAFIMPLEQWCLSFFHLSLMKARMSIKSAQSIKPSESNNVCFLYCFQEIFKLHTSIVLNTICSILYIFSFYRLNMVFSVLLSLIIIYDID